MAKTNYLNMNVYDVLMERRSSGYSEMASAFPPIYTYREGRIESKTKRIVAKSERDARSKVYVPIGFRIKDIKKVRRYGRLPGGIRD